MTGPGGAGPSAQPHGGLPPALLDAEMIPAAELQLDQRNLIGSGGFGLIYRSHFRGTEVAVKCSHGRLARNAEEERAMLAREAAMLRTLDHANVVRFLGCSLGAHGEVMIVMHLAANGSLSDYVKRRKTLDLPEVVRVAYGIAQGMAYLHARKPQIVHRDLNPRNILVDADHAPKIADFGISKEIKTRVSGTPDFTPWGDAYSSPEILAGEAQISAKADVWSFGCILRFLVTGTHPWEGMQPLAIAHKVVTERRKPDLPADCPEILRELIKLCWKRTPAKRTTFEALVQRLEWLLNPILAQRKRRLWKPPRPSSSSSLLPSPSPVGTPKESQRSAAGRGLEGMELSMDLAFLLPTRRLRALLCTWNLQGRPPPGSLAPLLPPKGSTELDLVVVGTEQCHRTISRAMVSGPGAEQWEQRLLGELGREQYRLVAREALASCHIAVFARRALVPHIAHVQTAKVATGIGGVGGNKGAVAVALQLGCTSFLFCSAYLASRPENVDARNEMYHQINGKLGLSPRPCPPASASASVLRGPVPAPSFSTPTPSASASSSRASTPSSSFSIPAYTPARPGSGGFAPPAPPLLSPADLAAVAAAQSPFLRPLAAPPEPPRAGLHSPPTHSPTGSANGAGFPPGERLYAARSTPSSSPPPSLGHAARASSAPLQPSSSASSAREGALDGWRAATPEAAAGALERFDRVFFMGDLNYRLNAVTRPEALALLERAGDCLPALLERDQLAAEMRAGRAFGGFREAPVDFPPTYKFDLDSDRYDSGPKQRVPAWTDRVLFASREAEGGGEGGPGVSAIRYRAVPNVRTSGHRPVILEAELSFQFCPACRSPLSRHAAGALASPPPEAAPPAFPSFTVKSVSLP